MELIYTLEQLDTVAQQIIDQIKRNNTTVVAFYGKMGSGKTTLIKALCQKLNVIDTVQSPTFAIINQYQTSDGTVVYHFDFYRLEKIEDAINIGAEEYFYSGDLCLIEWPEIIEPILPPGTMKIKIDILDKSTRKILINATEESISHHTGI